MAHRTNRYKKPAKRQAYERALELARTYTLDPGAHIDLARELPNTLTRQERLSIAAKAVYVTRGRRRRRAQRRKR